VLISGLGAQLVTWRSDFCRRLADRGYHGVRFDNRDVRLSTKFPDGSYTVADMADDVAGLIEALGFGSSHVVGQSLGGRIAQELVIRHPERVRSLCLLFSTRTCRTSSLPGRR
jgi:pimeloyl-ACP methyl ester carboxylesterase